MPRHTPKEKAKRVASFLGGLSGSARDDLILRPEFDDDAIDRASKGLPAITFEEFKKRRKKRK